jgi:hypothetical protein
MSITEYSVEIQQDFLERQAKATPVAAVAELIWNGLDADATRIDVDLEQDGLGGIAKVVVSDNGDGIPYGDAPALFRRLGGSWKSPARAPNAFSGCCTAKKDVVVSKPSRSAQQLTGKLSIALKQGHFGTTYRSLKVISDASAFLSRHPLTALPESQSLSATSGKISHH